MDRRQAIIVHLKESLEAKRADAEREASHRTEEREMLVKTVRNKSKESSQ